jgi:hypothetical protein
MTPVETAIFSACAGSAATFVGRLLWDKLNGNENGNGEPFHLDGPGRKCEDHESCIVTLTALKGSAENNRARLEHGDQQMREMAIDIKKTSEAVSSIKADVKVLVSRVDHRDAVFQKG